MKIMRIVHYAVYMLSRKSCVIIKSLKPFSNYIQWTQQRAISHHFCEKPTLLPYDLQSERLNQAGTAGVIQQVTPNIVKKVLGQ